MGIVEKIVNGRRVREVVEAVRALDEAMPPLPAQDANPAPAKKKPREANLASDLGERLGIAGIFAFTMVAAGVGAVRR